MDEHDEVAVFGDSLRLIREEAPRVLEFYLYWLKIRGTKMMPARADFDPIDVPRHLPGILLVDVLNQNQDGLKRFRYRVVGDWEVRNRGHNPTGKFVEEGYFYESMLGALSDYLSVCTTREPFFDLIEVLGQFDTPVQEYSIILPFSEDGTTVSQVIVYSERVC